MGWIVSPQIPMLKPWPPVSQNVTVLVDGVLKEVMELKLEHELGPNLIPAVSFWEKKMRTQLRTEGRPCEDTGRRWPSASQAERPEEKANLLTPWSWTSDLQDYEKINFCGLSHPACGASFWLPWKTNMASRWLNNAPLVLRPGAALLYLALLCSLGGLLEPPKITVITTRVLEGILGRYEISYFHLWFLSSKFVFPNNSINIPKYAYCIFWKRFYGSKPP